MKSFSRSSLFLLLPLTWRIQGSCARAQKDAKNDAEGILTNLAPDEMTTSVAKGPVSTSEAYASVSSLLAASSKFSTSASVSPTTSFEISSSTSSPVSTSFITTVSKALESSPGQSTLSASFLNVIPNNSSLGKSDFKIIKNYSIPICFDGKETYMNINCHDPITTLNITCYSDSRYLNICLLGKPINNFPSNDHFFSYVSSDLNRHPGKVLSVCHLTAEILYNVTYLARYYKAPHSGLKYALVLDKNLTNICLPIFEHFANCTTSSFLITCVVHDLVVVFFPYGCRPPPMVPETDIENAIVNLLDIKEFSEIKNLCEGYSGSSETGEAVSGPHESGFKIYRFLVVHNEENTTLYITCYRNYNSFDICLKEKPISTIVSNANFFSHVSDILNNSFENLFSACLYTATINYNKICHLSGHSDINGLTHFLIYDGRLVNVCHPLFQAFGNCTNYDMVTECVGENVTLSFFVGGCRLPSIPVKVINRPLLELVILKQFAEIKKICNGYLVNDEESKENPLTASSNESSVGESGFEISSLIIRPPCHHNNKSVMSHCFKGNDTLYVTCYTKGLTLKICLRGKPVKSFASYEQFFNYAKNTLDSQYDVGDLCIYTVTGNYSFSQRTVLVQSTASGKKYYLSYDGNVSEVCLPIFRYFGNCTDDDGIIKCVYNDIVIIVVTGGCSLPSRSREVILKIMIHAVMQNDIQRVKQLCEESKNIYEDDRNGITAVLIPDSDKSQPPLFPYYSANKFWPCCYDRYLVVWMEDPKPSGLSEHWSYLPLECRVGEIFFMTFQVAAALVGVLGNFIVLAVMFNGGHRGEASSIFRTFLSIADFLISVFVMVPSIIDSISIINNDIFETFMLKSSESVNASVLSGTLSSPGPDFHHTFSLPYGKLGKPTPYITVPRNYYNISILEEIATKSLFFPIFNYTNGWFQVIRGQMLSLCSCVTMIIMFYLSVERLVICWRPLKYKALFLMYRVKRAIFLAWSFGLISLVVISYGDSFTVYWNSWTKLSFGIHNTDPLHNEPVEVISVILCVIGILTVIMSVSALIAFLLEQRKVREERELLDMRITDDFEKENVYITITLVLMTVLYLITYLPVGINVLSKNEDFRLTRSPIFLFCSWWLLLCGSAVNPFVYNFRSHIFRSELAELIEKMLPESQKHKMKPYITHPRNPAERYLKSLDRDGLPKGSKLALLGLGFDNRSDSRKEEEEEEEDFNVAESAL